jgi:HEAT repeat protein
MHSDLTVIVIVTTITALLLVIAGLLVASVFRRVYHGRKYRELDVLQAEYRKKLTLALESAVGVADPGAFFAVPGSPAWQAVEDVLFDLMDEQGYREDIRRLFCKLGYVTFYENRLASRNILTKASAVDKLGRMQSELSSGKLLSLLDERDPEILSVTVRALSNIGTEEGLRGIIDRMPSLLGELLVTRKAMETALLNFGPAAIPFLIGYQGEHADPWIISCILETLSHLPVDERSVALAAELLKSPNAEVRSKALKVLGRTEDNLPVHMPERILPLLDDPVWFVRLQAVKAVKTLGGEKADAQLKKILFDENWQVRNEAALALTRLGDRSIGVFLDALTTSDGYAKESVCEEIEKTGFSDRLIENLIAADETLRTKSQEILKIMHGLHFSTPLIEYLAKGEDERIKQEIRSVMMEKPKP